MLLRVYAASAVIEGKTYIGKTLGACHQRCDIVHTYSTIVETCSLIEEAVHMQRCTDPSLSETLFRMAAFRDGVPMWVSGNRGPCTRSRIDLQTLHLLSTRGVGRVFANISAISEFMPGSLRSFRAHGLSGAYARRNDPVLTRAEGRTH